MLLALILLINFPIGDGLAKSKNFLILSFPRKRESSKIKKFWTPAGVYPDENRGRSDGFVGFYEIIIAKNIAHRKD